MVAAVAAADSPVDPAATDSDLQTEDLVPCPPKGLLHETASIRYRGYLTTDYLNIVLFAFPAAALLMNMIPFIF